MTTSAFSRWICNYYGTVSDCFIIHTPNIDAKVQPFDEENSFDGIHESFEDENENSGFVRHDVKVPVGRELVLREK